MNRMKYSCLPFADSSSKKALLSWLPVASTDQSMDVDSTIPSKQAPTEPVPEVEIYFYLLILHHLLTSPANYPKATRLALRHRSPRPRSPSQLPLPRKMDYAVRQLLRPYKLLAFLKVAVPVLIVVVVVGLLYWEPHRNRDLQPRMGQARGPHPRPARRVLQPARCLPRAEDGGRLRAARMGYGARGERAAGERREGVDGRGPGAACW